MKYYIYKITNKLNGKSYVGQHKVPKNKENFRRYMGKGIAIRLAIKKYGKDNFEKTILEYIDDDEKHEYVSQREIFWIKQENTLYPNGYNISPGGEGGCTKEAAQKALATRKKNGKLKLSEETKKKISLAHKGKKFSEIHKKNLSKNHHLKTLHTILLSNGNVLKTFNSVDIIAESFKITSSVLRRASEVFSFRVGVVILDLVDNEATFNHKFARPNSREKVFENPITKEKISPIEWRTLREHNKDYMKFSKHPYNDDYLIIQRYFFDELNKLKCLADGQTKINLNNFKGVIYVEN